MTYFQHCLVTRKFTLYTDHKPLCKLSSTHVKTLNRLQLKMTELSPEIRYIEGKNNTVADFLSRYHGRRFPKQVSRIGSRRQED
jgi:hypothetical protein